jgi:hypothetical protein
VNTPDLLSRAIDFAAVELAQRGAELATLAATAEHLTTVERARALVALDDAVGKLDRLLDRLRDAALGFHPTDEEDEP